LLALIDHCHGQSFGRHKAGDLVPRAPELWLGRLNIGSISIANIEVEDPAVQKDAGPPHPVRGRDQDHTVRDSPLFKIESEVSANETARGLAAQEAGSLEVESTLHAWVRQRPGR